MNNEFDEALRRNPHLAEYLNDFQKNHSSLPVFVGQLSREMALDKTPNILYPVGDPIFIHIYTEPKKDIQYIAIEPGLKPHEKELYNAIVERVLEKAVKITTPVPKDGLSKTLLGFVDEITKIGTVKKRRFNSSTIMLTKEEHEKFKYLIVRDILDSGPVESMLCDPYLEDIHCVGLNPISVVHKVFGNLNTNIKFEA